MEEEVDKEILKVITDMMVSLAEINRLKSQRGDLDARALSIAATHLETAQLWVANARKDA